MILTNFLNQYKMKM